jgi:hypothetical protein
MKKILVFCILFIGVMNSIFARELNTGKNIYIDPKIMNTFSPEPESAVFGFKADVGYRINSSVSVFMGSGITLAHQSLIPFDLTRIGLPYFKSSLKNEDNIFKLLVTEIGIKLKF